MSNEKALHRIERMVADQDKTVQQLNSMVASMHESDSDAAMAALHMGQRLINQQLTINLYLVVMSMESKG